MWPVTLHTAFWRDVMAFLKRRGRWYSFTVAWPALFAFTVMILSLLLSFLR